MVMIRCPSCGQRTLDVASQCPKCGHVLLQNRLEANSHSDLVSCRRCGKHIDRRSVVCPFCGHHVQRARKVVAAGWALGGLAVATAAGYGAYRAGYLDRAIPGPQPPAATVAAPDIAAPDTTPAALPIVVRPADQPNPAPAPVAPLGERDRSPPVPSSPLQVRWTADWVNVREARSIDSPVVRVLAPGRQINVAGMRNGWWEYYEEGTMRGYVANSVLGSQPPG